MKGLKSWLCVQLEQSGRETRRTEPIGSLAVYNYTDSCHQQDSGYTSVLAHGTGWLFVFFFIHVTAH